MEPHPRRPFRSSANPWEKAKAEMRPRVLAAILMLASAGVALFCGPRSARPLPLFSRSLGTSCATCHDAVPHLNAVGTRFMQSGYRLEGHTAEPTGRAAGLPLSVVGSAGITSVRAEPDRPMIGSGFSTFELVAAGAPTNRISCHLDAGVARTGFEFQNGEDFLRFEGLLPAGALALEVGRFDAELPFLSSERRLTMTRYLSPIAFGARGLELNGAHASWTYAAGLSLSDRTYAGGASPHAIQPPLEDTYLRLARTVGEQSFGAQMLFDRQNSDLATLSWLQHMRIQLGASLAGPGFTLVPSYVFDRFDDRPMPGVHERHQYYMLESIVPLGAARRWLVTGRYEHEYRTPNTYDPEEHRQQAVVQLAWQVIPNARIALECARADDRLAHQGSADVDAFAQASW